MEDSDDIDSFLNFARDLVELIPVNVQTTHKQKTKGQKSKQTGQNSPQKGSKLKAPATTRASTGNELKERLQTQLSAFKNARQPKKAFNEAEIAAREEKKLLKRAQKKQKRQRTIDRQKDGQSVPQQRGNQKKAEEISADNPMRIERKGEPAEENIEFGKFDFVTGHEAKASGGKVAAEAGGDKGRLEGKASVQQLKAAEGLQKRIKFLESTNPEKADELKKQHAWDKALAHSQGQKIQDDPDKIKKSLANEARRKKKSKTKWKERSDDVSSKLDERQMKRKSNLQDRIDTKKKKKLNSAKKRGRIL